MKAYPTSISLILIGKDNLIPDLSPLHQNFSLVNEEMIL